MSNPIILLVPGSFCPPDLYDNIVGPVSTAGYEIKALHMPTVGLGPAQGRDGVQPTMYDDAAFIAENVQSLADLDKDVILIGHSYGGIPVSQSTQGLSKKERQSAGKPGGIVRIAYMTCLTPALGGSAAQVLSEVPKKYQVNPEIDDNGWATHTDLAKVGAIVVQNLPPAEREVFAKKMAKHSIISFTNELTYAGYKDIPVSYLYCEEDLCIPPSVQKEGIDMIERESGSKLDVTAIKADHCPNASAPQDVIDWIIRVAQKA